MGLLSSTCFCSSLIISSVTAPSTDEGFAASDILSVSFSRLSRGMVVFHYDDEVLFFQPT